MGNSIKKKISKKEFKKKIILNASTVSFLYTAYKLFQKLKDKNLLGEIENPVFDSAKKPLIDSAEKPVIDSKSNNIFRPTYQCFKIRGNSFYLFWKIDKILKLNSDKRNKSGDHVPLSLWEIYNDKKYQLSTSQSQKDLQLLRILLEDKRKFTMIGMPAEGECDSGELVSNYIKSKSKNKIECYKNIFSSSHDYFETVGLDYPIPRKIYTIDNIKNILKIIPEYPNRFGTGIDNINKYIDNQNFYLTINSGIHWDVIILIK